MRPAHRLFAAALLLVGAACSNDPAGSGESAAGTLIVRLTTTHSDDGAVLFELNGPPIDTVVAVNASLRLFTRRASDAVIVGALVGAVANGAMVTLRVPDVGAASRYTARVLDVADRNDVLRASLAGYALTVER